MIMRNHKVFLSIFFLFIASILEPPAAQDIVWAYRPPAGAIDVSPAAGDVDGDGRPDLVAVAAIGDVVAVDSSGQQIWRRPIAGPLATPPSLANITGEPGLEVLVVNNAGEVFCLDGATGQVVWESKLPHGMEWGSSAIAVDDLDGDGALEVVAGDERGAVTCIAGAGAPRWAYQGDHGVTMCPAIADVHSGPEKEVIIGGRLTPLLCLSHEGKLLWKLGEKARGSSPVVADLDGDGRPEIVVVAGKTVLAVDGGGKRLWAAEMRREVDGALTAVDATGDGSPEVFAVDITGHFACFSAKGEQLWTASVEERARRSPVVADCDGDGALEILVAGYSGAIHVFSADGYLETRVPLPGGPTNASVTILPLGPDKRLGVVCPAIGGVMTAFLWPDAKAGAAAPWPEYRGGPARLGMAAVNTAGPAVEIASFDPGSAYVGSNTFRVTVTNPENRRVHVELSVEREEGPARSQVELDTAEIVHEMNYVITGEHMENLRFTCEVSEGGRPVTKRSQAIFVTPFQKELADLETLFTKMADDLERVAQKGGVEERLFFLRAQTPAFHERARTAGTMSATERRRLRDELAQLRSETATLASLLEAAAKLTADGQTVHVAAANPWAPFGGMDELREGRLAGPGIEVTAFHGEHECAALNVFNLGPGAQTLRLELSALSSAEGATVPAREALQAHEIVSVPTQTLDYSADAAPRLNQAQTLLVPGWEARQVWLDIGASKLAPGEWTAEIRLRTVEVEPETITAPLKITVWDTPLPQKQALNLCHWGYVHTSVLKDQPDAALQDQLDLGTNVFVGLFYPRATFDEGGALVGEIDYAAHDAYVKTHAPHGRILFFNYQTALNGPAQPGSEAYRKAHVAWLRAWVAHLKELGVGYEGFALYPVDEPGLSAGLVDIYLTMAKLAREADPKILLYTDPVMRITLEELHAMAPYVDIWCPNRNGFLLKENADKLAFIKSTGAEVWTYECDAQAKHQSPLGYYRAQAWLVWRHGLTGIGFWSYCTAQDDPWFYPASGNEYLLIYQGEGVVRSKRWFAVRDGVEDYSMLTALREAADKARADGRSPEAVARAQKLLGPQASAIGAFCGPDPQSTTPGRFGLPGARRTADGHYTKIQAIRAEMAETFAALRAP